MPHGVFAPSSPRRALGGAILFLIALGLAALGLAADSMLTAILATAAEAPVQRTLTGDHVVLYTLAGAVRLEPGTGSAVEAEITTGGRDAGQLRIESGAIGGRGTLRVVFPGTRVIYPEIGRGSSTQMRVRDDGTFGDRRQQDLFGARTVRISGSGSGLEAHADMRVRVPAGRRVEIYVGAGRIDAANVDGRIRLDAASAPVTATRMKGSLVVDTGSGDVSVSDTGADVSLDTGSGGVELSRVAGPSLLVDTGSGGVHGTDIAVEKLSVDTGSGGIELSNVKADHVVLDTGSGSVWLDLVAQADRIGVDTGSGDVTVRLPEGFGAEVSIETGSGDIETDLELTSVRRSGDALVGRAGDGRCALRLETGSGDVRLEQAAHGARR